MLIYSQFYKALSLLRRNIFQSLHKGRKHFSNNAQSFQSELGLPTAAFLI